MDFSLQQLQEALATVTHGMTAETLQRSREGKWSVSEILEHLYLTYTGTIKVFEKCLAAGAPIAGKARLENRIAVFVVTRMGYMPEGRKAPKSANPRGIPTEQVLTEMGPKIMAMDELIGRCEERYGKETRLIDHPILGPLTGQQWRKFHLVHGRHHLRQIQRLKKQGHPALV